MSLNYLGTWNALTNIPHVESGSGTLGDVYQIAVGGANNIGQGSVTYKEGYSIVYDINGQWVQTPAQYTIDLADVYNSTNISSPVWIKIGTYTFDQFSSATNSITISSGYTLPANTILNAVAVTTITGFSGGSISDYTIAVLGSLSPVTFSLFNVFTGPQQAALSTITTGYSLVDNLIKLTATSTSDTLDHAIQGTVYIYVLTSKLP